MTGARMSQSIRKMTQGTLGGQSRAATMRSPFVLSTPSIVSSPDAFDPDWQGATYINVDNPHVGLAVAFINNAAPPFEEGGLYFPDGQVGDEIFLWVMSQRRADTPDELAWSIPPTLAFVKTYADEYAPGFYNEEAFFDMTTVGEFGTGESALSLWAGHAIRPPDMGAISIVFDEEAGPTAWIIGNFPAGTWALHATTTPAGDTTTLTGGSSTYAGGVMATRDPLVGEPRITLDGNGSGLLIPLDVPAEPPFDHTRYTPLGMLSAWGNVGPLDLDIASLGGDLLATTLHKKS